MIFSVSSFLITNLVCIDKEILFSKYNCKYFPFCKSCESYEWIFVFQFHEIVNKVFEDYFWWLKAHRAAWFSSSIIFSTKTFSLFVKNGEIINTNQAKMLRILALIRIQILSKSILWPSRKHISKYSHGKTASIKINKKYRR